VSTGGVDLGSGVTRLINIRLTADIGPSWGPEDQQGDQPHPDPSHRNGGAMLRLGLLFHPKGARAYWKGDETSRENRKLDERCMYERWGILGIVELA
jgi:hypothetical protein